MRENNPEVPAFDGMDNAELLRQAFVQEWETAVNGLRQVADFASRVPGAQEHPAYTFMLGRRKGALEALGRLGPYILTDGTPELDEEFRSLLENE